MNASDDLMMLGRVLGGLVVVVVLMLLVARFARRRGMGGGAAGLRVVERVALTREAHVAVVEVGGRSLLLGVTAQGVTMLTGLGETPRQQAPIHVVLEAPAAHDPVVDESPRRTARRAAEPSAAPPAPAARPAATRAADPQETGMRLPPGLDVEGYADLASALRAAGRTTSVSTDQAEPPAPAAPQQRTDRQDLPRRADVRGARTRPAAVPPQRQASGSPLSPATWRQGIDALRDYTVRRG